MYHVSSVRIGVMALFAVLAIILAFVPLIVSILSMMDLQNWPIYAVAYIASALFALVLTGSVYVVRDL